MPEPQPKTPPPHGSWRWGWPSPDGRTLLLQWSGECETPNAFFADVESGRVRPVTGERDWRHAPESSAYGWLHDGRAVVYLPRGGCGNGYKRPGYYAIDPRSGRADFLRAAGAYWTSN
jgi:hypothetical protein